MSARGPDPLLELHHLGRLFGQFVAVDDVSFRVGAGEVVGLLGANGAGKTTVLRMAIGLLAPSSGQARLLGRRPDRAARARIGYVPQGLGLYADMSVRENLEFVAAVYGQPRPQVPAALADVGEDARRAHLAGHPARAGPHLRPAARPRAGGARRAHLRGRSALARTALWDAIRERAEAGVGVLVTTHYMQEAQQCDRLLLMAGGPAGRRGQRGPDRRCHHRRAGQRRRLGGGLRRPEPAGLPVTLAGTDVRVADVPPERVARELADAGVTGQVQAVPATIEERMTVLAGG